MNSILDLQKARVFIGEILEIQDVEGIKNYCISLEDKVSDICLSEYSLEDYIDDGFPSYSITQKISTYWVTLNVTGYVTVEVTAESEEEASSLANDSVSWMTIDNINSTAEEVDQALSVDGFEEIERQDS